MSFRPSPPLPLLVVLLVLGLLGIWQPGASTAPVRREMPGFATAVSPAKSFYAAPERGVAGVPAKVPSGREPSATQAGRQLASARTALPVAHGPTGRRSAPRPLRRSLVGTVELRV